MDFENTLSMESAVSFLRSPEETKTDAPVVADKAAPEESKADAPVEASDKTDEHSQDDAPAASSDDQDTPADQGETNDGEVDPGDALPPIDPPSSWTAEEKAEWASLNRKAQEAIQRRDRADTKALRDGQDRYAEQHKAAEAEVIRLKGLASQVEALVQRDVQDLAREYPEIRTETDVVALAQSDPARYATFQAKLLALNAANQSRANALGEVAKAEEAKKTELLSKAKDALLEAFPTWKDPDVARREVTEIQDYAIKMGAPEAAARASLDPVVYKLGQKAMLYDRAQAAKASAVNRTPPRVVKPGAKDANPKATAKEDARRTQLAKLDQSGDLMDALALMRG